MNISNTLKKITPYLFGLGLFYFLCFVTDFLIKTEGLGRTPALLLALSPLFIAYAVQIVGKRWPAYDNAAFIFCCGAFLLTIWLLSGLATHAFMTWRAEKSQEEADLYRLVTSQELNDAIKECPSLKAEILRQNAPIANYHLTTLKNNCARKEQEKIQGATDREKLAEQLKGVK